MMSKPLIGLEISLAENKVCTDSVAVEVSVDCITEIVIVVPWITISESELMAQDGANLLSPGKTAVNQ
jgi:hypothetical protein